MAGVSLAGKTGSAENPFGDAHSWFLLVAPADSPQVAVAVLVENGGHGASAALPLAAYLLFLLGNLVLNLWHSLLSLPAKLDELADNEDEQIKRGQRDTVTTEE